MKKISRILAIILALVMVLSGSVFAAWVSFQKNANNNGVIDGNPPIGRVKVTSLQLPSGGYVGVDVPPVVDSNGYAYVLESAQGSTRLVKVDLANKSIVNTGAWNGGIVVRDVSAFQLSTPVINEDYIYVATTDFAQQNVDEAFQTLVSGTSAWTLTNNNSNNAHPPVFNQADGFVKVTDSQTPMGLNFTLSQTFTGVSGDNLRIECTALGSELSSGTLKVYLNASTTPLINLDLSAQVGYAVNQSVSNSALVNGTNTLKIEIIASADSSATDPYVYLGTFRFFEENGAVARYDLSSGAKEVIVNGIPGQLNTPLTIKSNKLYFGSYYAGGGKYYQANIASGTTFPVTPVEFNSGKSHYWAGAYVSSSNAYFGGFDGMLYYPSVSSFSTVTGHSLTVSYGNITATDICSSICYKDYKIYFTSKNGYLWCYDITNDTPVFSWYADLGAPSTSTPVVSPNGTVYVGTYNGFTNGSVVAVTAPASKDNVVGTVHTVFSGKPVQSSVILKNYSNNTGTDYIYFTTNSSDGAGYCYCVNTSTFNSTLEWNTVGKPNSTYTLQGMAADGNCVVFGNDNSMFYIVVADPTA